MLSDIFWDESCRMFAGASLYAVQVFPCLPSHLTAPSLDSTPPCSWIHVSILTNLCNNSEKSMLLLREIQLSILTNPSLYAVQVFPCLPSILITWIERHRAAGYLAQINSQKGFIWSTWDLAANTKILFKEGLRYSPYNVTRALYWLQEIEAKGWKIWLAGTIILHMY